MAVMMKYLENLWQREVMSWNNYNEVISATIHFVTERYTMSNIIYVIHTFIFGLWINFQNTNLVLRSYVWFWMEILNYMAMLRHVLNNYDEKYKYNGTIKS